MSSASLAVWGIVCFILGGSACGELRSMLWRTISDSLLSHSSNSKARDLLAARVSDGEFLESVIIDPHLVFLVWGHEAGGRERVLEQIRPLLELGRIKESLRRCARSYTTTKTCVITKVIRDMDNTQHVIRGCNNYVKFNYLRYTRVARLNQFDF